MATTALALAGELTQKTGLRCGALAGDGDYAFEIVGHERFQAALAELAGGPTPGVVGIKCNALLVPGPKNPRDLSAVLVQIRGRDVGYLGRNLAPIVSRTLADAGYSAAVVAAVIVGGPGGSKSGKGEFRVRLDAVHPFRFEEPRKEKAAGPPAMQRAVGAATHGLSRTVGAAASGLSRILGAATSGFSRAGSIAAAALRSLLPLLQAIHRTAVLGARRSGELVRDVYVHVRGSPKIQARLAWAAIFVAGMAVGSGLTVWVRPAAVQPAIAAAPAARSSPVPDFGPPEVAPPEPEGVADDASAPVMPAVDIPLPRLRPTLSTAGKADATAVPQ